MQLLVLAALHAPASVFICKYALFKDSPGIKTDCQPHLAHEFRDDAVEDGALVAKALLTSAEDTEVLSSLGHHIVTKLQKQNKPTVSQLLQQRTWIISGGLRESKE